MTSVVVVGFGVMLGRTSERLVVRGPRPRLELVEGGPQLLPPLDLPARSALRVVTSDGVKTPPDPLRRPKTGNGAAPRAKPEQVELPLFQVSEIVVAGGGISISMDLIEECCERGIHLSFLTLYGWSRGSRGSGYSPRGESGLVYDDFANAIRERGR